MVISWRKDKYEALLREYKEALGRDNTFADQVHELSEKQKYFVMKQRMLWSWQIKKIRKDTSKV